MYSRFAEEKNWRIEVLNASEAEQGGYKEVVARLSGSTNDLNVTGSNLPGTNL